MQKANKPLLMKVGISHKKVLQDKNYHQTIVAFLVGTIVQQQDNIKQLHLKIVQINIIIKYRWHQHLMQASKIIRILNKQSSLITNSRIGIISNFLPLNMESLIKTKKHSIQKSSQLIWIFKYLYFQMLIIIMVELQKEQHKIKTLERIKVTILKIQVSYIDRILTPNSW